MTADRLSFQVRILAATEGHLRATLVVDGSGKVYLESESVQTVSSSILATIIVLQ